MEEKDLKILEEYAEKNKEQATYLASLIDIYTDGMSKVSSSDLKKVLARDDIFVERHYMKKFADWGVISAPVEIKGRTNYYPAIIYKEFDVLVLLSNYVYGYSLESKIGSKLTCIALARVLNMIFWNYALNIEDCATMEIARDFADRLVCVIPEEIDKKQVKYNVYFRSGPELESVVKLESRPTAKTGNPLELKELQRITISYIFFYGLINTLFRGSMLDNVLAYRTYDGKSESDDNDGYPRLSYGYNLEGDKSSWQILINKEYNIGKARKLNSLYSLFPFGSSDNNLSAIKELFKDSSSKFQQTDIDLYNSFIRKHKSDRGDTTPNVFDDQNILNGGVSFNKFSVLLNNEIRIEIEAEEDAGGNVEKFISQVYALLGEPLNSKKEIKDKYLEVKYDTKPISMDAASLVDDLDYVLPILKKITKYKGDQIELSVWLEMFYIYGSTMGTVRDSIMRGMITATKLDIDLEDSYYLRLAVELLITSGYFVQCGERRRLAVEAILGTN